MVVDRPGEPVDVDADIGWIRVEVPRLEVSSTDLRARFTDGRPLDYLVTQPVLDVIRVAWALRGAGVTAIAGRRTRRTIVGAVTAMLLVVAAAVMFGVGVVTLSNSQEGEAVGVDTRPRVEFPATPNAAARCGG